MEPVSATRRSFHLQTMGSLLTFSLLETVFRYELLADEAKPLTAKWVADVHQLGLDLKGRKLEQLEWQKKIAELMARVDLADLLKMIDFERLAAGAKLVDKGDRSLRFSFPKVEGLPTEFCYGKQIFALKKGCSVVPHGHNNMATAFLILQGDLRGRHYDRLQDEPEHMIIRPTLDREFRPGECSTVSDFKDNVHWFQALTEPAFIFNLHLLGVRPGSPLRTGRIYVDPQGEKLSDGSIRARVIDFKTANELYG